MSERSFKPAVTVPLALTGIVAVVTAVLVAGFLSAAGLLGPALSRTLAGAVALLGTLAALRLIVRIYVLRQTRYVVEGDRLVREFSLLYRHRSTEIPISQLRGVELSQSAFQTWLGYGDLRFITTGPNGSLGFLAFEDIPDPRERRATIRDRLDTEE